MIKQRFPDAAPAEVQRRLEATADPSPAGGRSDDYGYGLLNPYRALSETLGPVSPPPAVPEKVRAVDPAAADRVARRADARRSALLSAVLGAAGVLLIAVAAIVGRRGRRRGWRPAVAGAATDASASR